MGPMAVVGGGIGPVKKLVNRVLRFKVSDDEHRGSKEGTPTTRCCGQMYVHTEQRYGNSEQASDEASRRGGAREGDDEVLVRENVKIEGQCDNV
ncbi:hypothetical protein LINPERPRIM_LOCUS4358 [Linum perenne]